MPAVKGVVRAMDAIQQLTAGEGSVSSFVVAGAGESAWTAWLVAAVDQRVRAVVPAGIDPGAARGLAIADIEDLGIYEARVQVPLLDANDSSAIDARVAEGYLLGTPAP